MLRTLFFWWPSEQQPRIPILQQVEPNVPLGSVADILTGTLSVGLPPRYTLHGPTLDALHAEARRHLAGGRGGKMMQVLLPGDGIAEVLSC